MNWNLEFRIERTTNGGVDVSLFENKPVDGSKWPKVTLIGTKRVTYTKGWTTRDTFIRRINKTKEKLLQKYKENYHFWAEVDGICKYMEDRFIVSDSRLERLINDLRNKDK